MGTYTDKPSVCIHEAYLTIGSAKMEGGRLHGDGHLLRTIIHYVHVWSQHEHATVLKIKNYPNIVRNLVGRVKLNNYMYMYVCTYL